MSDLIPIMPITEFRKLKASEIKKLKSVEIFSDGEHLFTAIIPHGDSHSTDYVKAMAENLGLTANMSGGVDPGELIGEKEAVAV